MKKYLYTNLYNWEILSDDTHIMWVRRNDRGGGRDGFIHFSYYPQRKLMKLDQGISIDCQSIDEANYFASKVLKRHYIDMPEEFQGRYFKIKKLQKISKSTF